LNVSHPLFRGALLGLLVMLLAETARVFLGSNFHTVVPHRCYRSGQPTPQWLGDVTNAVGIRTVINLRGANNPEEELWYQPEKDAAAQLHLNHIDIGLSAYAPPPASEWRALIEALDGSEEPILVHCHSGSDRSGLASAAYLLLKTNTSLADASNQVHLRFGHNPWGGAACQQLVLGQYADWLREHGWEHRPDRFRHWACEEYVDCHVP
jgi:protein-tyrosine phosphatase